MLSASVVNWMMFAAGPSMTRGSDFWITVEALFCDTFHSVLEFSTMVIGPMDGLKDLQDARAARYRSMCPLH